MSTIFVEFSALLVLGLIECLYWIQIPNNNELSSSQHNFKIVLSFSILITYFLFLFISFLLQFILKAIQFTYPHSLFDYFNLIFNILISFLLLFLALNQLFLC